MNPHERILSLLEWENELSHWEQEWVYAEGGALSQKGEACFGLPEQVIAEFDQFASMILATMTDPEQRAAFTRIWREHGVRLDMMLRRHALAEAQRLGLW